MTFPLSAVIVVSVVLAQAPAPPITAAAFAPDSRTLVLGSQTGMVICTWPDLRAQRPLASELSHIHDLAFAPDGKLLLAAGGTPAEDGIVEWWSWPAGKLLRRIGGHTDLVYRVAWRHDGQQWATASADGTCRLHPTATSEVLQTFKGHSGPVLAICYLPDGKELVSAGIDQTLQLWDAATGQLRRTLDNHVGPVNDLALRPGVPGAAPPVVASASDDKTVRLWQPTLGRLMRFKRMPAAARVVAWSPDGDRLFVGCADGWLRVLDPDSLEVVHQERILKGWIHTLAVPRQGTGLFVGGDGGQRKRVLPVR